MRSALKKYHYYLWSLGLLLVLLVVCMVQLTSEGENSGSVATLGPVNSSLAPTNQHSPPTMNLSGSARPESSTENKGFAKTAARASETQFIPQTDNSENSEPVKAMISESRINTSFQDPNIVVGSLLNAYDVQTFEQAWNDLEKNLSESVLLRLLSAYETEMTAEQKERTLVALMNAKTEDMSQADLAKIEAIISQEIMREDSNLMLDIMEKLNSVVSIESEDSEESTN